MLDKTSSNGNDGDDRTTSTLYFIIIHININPLEQCARRHRKRDKERYNITKYENDNYLWVH